MKSGDALDRVEIVDGDDDGLRLIREVHVWSLLVWGKISMTKRDLPHFDPAPFLHPKQKKTKEHFPALHSCLPIPLDIDSFITPRSA